MTDKTSGAYNNGRVFVHGASESTAIAYRDQFRRDLGEFLRLRSVEMKRSGSMFLVCLGRTSPDPADQGGPGLLFGTHFQDAWDDLVGEVTQLLHSFFILKIQKGRSILTFGEFFKRIPMLCHAMINCWDMT